MNFRVFDRVVDTVSGLGCGVIVDIEANPHQSSEWAVLTIDFGEGCVFNRHADEVRSLPSVIVAKGSRLKFIDDELKPVSLGNFNATPLVMELEWSDFAQLDDGVNAANLLSDQVKHLETSADFEILDSICAYFGIDMVDFSLQEAVKDGRLSPHVFSVNKELYRRYFKEMHVQQDVRLPAQIKEELAQEFDAWIEKACAISNLGAAEDELEDLMQYVLSSSFNVAERLRDVIPTVRFGDENEPCWRVELVIPITEMGVDKRNFALIHAETEEKAREIAMQLIRMHMKNAMRLARTGDVEPYDPETQYDEFNQNLQAEI